MSILILVIVMVAFLLARLRAVKLRQRLRQNIKMADSHVPEDWVFLHGQTVTFLVPAWNAEDDINEFIASFHTLTLPDKQLVMCVGGKDDSLLLAQSFIASDVIVVEQTAGMGKQKALRKSYPLATGNLIYLTDVDCRLDDSTVKEMLFLLETQKFSAVTGPIRPLIHQESYAFVRAQWAVERFLALTSHDRVSGLRGNNAIVTRDAIDHCGALSKDTFSGTDYTMAKELLLAGYCIGYQRRSEMASEYPASFHLYVRKQARWIRNVVVLGLKYKEFREVRAVLTTLLQPIVYLVLIVAGFAWPALWSIVLALFLYAILNRIDYGRFSGVKVGLSGAATHMAGDLFASLTVIYQLLSKRFTW